MRPCFIVTELHRSRSSRDFSRVVSPNAEQIWSRAMVVNPIGCSFPSGPTRRAQQIFFPSATHFAPNTHSLQLSLHSSSTHSATAPLPCVKKVSSNLAKSPIDSILNRPSRLPWPYPKTQAIDKVVIQLHLLRSPPVLNSFFHRDHIPVRQPTTSRPHYQENSGTIWCFDLHRCRCPHRLSF